MHALFVHGMGRTPLSGAPLLWRLRAQGVRTRVFGYVAALENFDRIAARLHARLLRLAQQGPYVVIGHSLGGVLLRAALDALPPGTSLPQRIFLLGSPMRPSRLAQRMHKHPVYRLLAGDPGQLLANAQRMTAIPPAPIPTTHIIGTKDFRITAHQFGGEPNDGVVAASEVVAVTGHEEIHLPVMHTWLPSSPLVSAAILARIKSVP
ncbi:MAG: alpha/beta hydrolase [Burkholderiaceae bacterium]|nr:MAG: alpha/beta hydrolase [Burkholderiaceae bacterium]